MTTAPRGGRPTPPAVRILGIDPGTTLLGWGIVDACGAQLARIDGGTLRGRGERADRLAAIHDLVRELCARFRPEVLSLEQSFVGDNVQSAFRLGEARGAVMVAASHSQVPVAEYSPAQIKVAVTGSGRAAKGQMQLMVGRLLAVAAPLAEDEADALAAAICHVHVGQFAALVAAARPAAHGARRGRGVGWRR